MKFMVINIDHCSRIELINKELYLEEVINNSSTNAGYKKKYFKKGDYFLEYIELEGDLRNLDGNLLSKRRKIDKLILICTELNKEKIQKILDLYEEDYDFTILCCSINLADKFLSDNIQIIKNTILLPQLFNNESPINVSFILKMILLIRYMGEQAINSKAEPELPILIGYGQGEYAAGEVVIKILENFRYIQRCKEFYLTLFSKEKLDIRELSYIEDPLREYMVEDNSLIINQSLHLELDNFICFCMSVIN